jgi:hypothetical protein
LFAAPPSDALAALRALSAYGGGAGLITGSLDLGVTATARMPFHSTVLGGLALIAVVALPSTALAWLAARGHHRTGDASIVAGILLVGWILIELAFIRELSFFHPSTSSSACCCSGRRHDSPP